MMDSLRTTFTREELVRARDETPVWVHRAHWDARIAEWDRQAAIWTDGPDSEADRAYRGEGTLRKLRQVCEDCRGHGTRWTIDGHDEATCGHCCGSGWANSESSTPDPAHTPAVRRVVAWVPTLKRTDWTGREIEPRPLSTIMDAYVDAATIRAELNTPCAMRFRRRTGVGRRSTYTAKVLARYARLLRHWDEEAGHR